MANILGLFLIIVSIYFLGQNIIFTTHYYSSWWQNLSAGGSVFALLLGVASLTFWRQEMGGLGWLLVGFGILLVFLSGGVILQPTSLWSLLVAMLSFTTGYQLMTTGKIRF